MSSEGASGGAKEGGSEFVVFFNAIIVLSVYYKIYYCKMDTRDYTSAIFFHIGDNKVIFHIAPRIACIFRVVSVDQILVTVLLLTLVILWVFREPGFMAGWAHYFPNG